MKARDDVDARDDATHCNQMSQLCMHASQHASAPPLHGFEHGAAKLTAACIPLVPW